MLGYLSLVAPRAPQGPPPRAQKVGGVGVRSELGRPPWARPSLGAALAWVTVGHLCSAPDGQQLKVQGSSPQEISTGQVTEKGSGGTSRGFCF